MNRILIALCVLLVSACATPYQPRGALGGFTDTQLDKNTIRISFNGNAYAQRDSVENYVLYRSAEVTVEKGFDYFVVVDSSAEVKHGAITTPGTYRSSTSAYAFSPGYATATTTGTYTPDQTVPFRKYGATVMIKMFNGQKPENLPNAYDARELKGYLEPHIKRK